MNIINTALQRPCHSATHNSSLLDQDVSGKSNTV